MEIHKQLDGNPEMLYNSKGFHIKITKQKRV